MQPHQGGDRWLAERPSGARHAGLRTAGLRMLLLATGVVLLACRMPPRARPPELPTSPMREICGGEERSRDAVCSSSERLEALLSHPSLEVIDAFVTSHGTTKPQRVRVRVTPEGEAPLLFFAKWKQAPASGDRANNSPRRELAAYQLQRMLFNGDDELVPPTILRCLDASRLPASMHAERFPNTGCSLGVLAFWVMDAKELGDTDEQRFMRDSVYRRRISNLNVFTYLAEHRDSAGLNFLATGDGRDLRVFAVDNGLTFGMMRHSPLSLFLSRRTKLRVPTISADLAARLRTLDRKALDRLSIVSRFDLRGGLLVPSGMDGPPWSAEEGVRKRADGIEFGLTRVELDEIDEHRRTLLDRLERGEVTTF